jgi:hypothetical protein
MKSFSLIHNGLRPLSARLLVAFCALTMLSAVPARISAGTKHDKFKGTIVFAGPKAITVKNDKNIYLVRTFNYTPALEKKVNAKRPPQGKKVIVHYLRGTDIATSLD